MAAIVVNLTDTFNEWREKTNNLSTNIGDLSLLTAQNSANLVAAMNGMMDELSDDTIPKLGGNLDLNSNDITGTGNINFTGILTSTSIAGTVTGTTQSPGNNSTKLATTAYVDAQVATEDTLAEMNDTTMSGLANLDILQYNSSGTTWENKTLSAAGIPTKGFTVAMAVALG